MSLPIKDTPILYNEEAERFLKRMEESEKVKIPSDEIIALAKAILKTAKI